jgi:cell division protein FtsB
MQNKHKILAFLKNKFILATLSFLAVVIFFDRNNLFTMLDYKKELNKLENTNRDYKLKIRELNKINEDLKRNPLTIQRIAREKYGMKRPEETIFLVPENK